MIEEQKRRDLEAQKVENMMLEKERKKMEENKRIEEERKD